jgi:D-glycero-alpha-D-manno-heptose-7-phosphate kinase
MSLFGGGTDYPSWYREHGGAVLTTTIDRYCHICLRRMPPFLGSKYRVFWSKMENVNEVSEIEHPGVRGCLQYFGIEDGLEINHAGDLPARSGLGSSSAFTVGMLHALHLLLGEDAGPALLADQAVYVEQDVLAETVGIQDQIECAWGGINHITINTDRDYAINPVLLDRERIQALEAHLVLVFTGLQRHASEIARAQVENAGRKTEQLHRIAELVPQAVETLSAGTPLELGALLHETWMLKRELSDKVSTPEIDDLYTTARWHGAVGGKVLGAGGGGFVLLCVPPERREKMLEALGLYAVPVRFEHGGSQVVLR